MKLVLGIASRWISVAGLLGTLAVPVALASEPPVAPGSGQGVEAAKPTTAPAEVPALGTPAKAVTLGVEAMGFSTDEGRARFALFRSKDGFPSKFAKSQQILDAEIKAGRARTSFQGLEPGTYAIAVHHDANANGRVDTNWIGMPKEGLGVSKDAKGSFGPPGFDDAKFEVTEGGTTISLKIIYL